MHRPVIQVLLHSKPVQIGVPTLGNGMLVILGVLMAVIALRVIGSGQGALNKIASVTILSSGLLLSGYGIENSIAGGSSVNASGGNCGTGATLRYDPNVFQNFNNQCSIPVFITDTSVSCYDSAVEERGCSENDIIEPGSSCALAACVGRLKSLILSASKKGLEHFRPFFLSLPKLADLRGRNRYSNRFQPVGNGFCDYHNDRSDRGRSAYSAPQFRPAYRSALA